MATTTTSKKQPKLEKNIYVFLNRNISILALAFSIFIFVYSYLAIIKPKYDGIVTNLQSNINAKDLEYLSKKEKVDSLKELIVFYKGTTQTNVAKIDRMLPEHYVKERLFVELGHLVVQGGFTLDYVGIERENEMTEEEREKATGQKKDDEPKTIIEARELPKEVDRTQVSLQVSNIDYFGLKYLVSVLENNLKLVDIIDIEFDPGENITVINFWTYHLKT